MKHSIQKITPITIGISEQSTLLCEQKNCYQSSDFPVHRTGSYRHKKALIVTDILSRTVSELWHQLIVQIFYTSLLSHPLGRGA